MQPSAKRHTAGGEEVRAVRGAGAASGCGSARQTRIAAAGSTAARAVERVPKRRVNT
jgi:hypothetical protein